MLSNFFCSTHSFLIGVIFQTVGILQRHLKSSERGHTFEELVELTRGSPRRSVDMMIGRLEFTQLGEFNLSKPHCLKITQNASFCHFPPIFVQLKMICLVTLFDRNFNKVTIFAIFGLKIET